MKWIFNTSYLLLIVFGCTYEPEDIYYKKIDQSVTKLPELDFFTEGDSIYLRAFTSIDITNSGEGAFDFYELWLGDSIIRSGDYYARRIPLNSSEFADGIYDIVLKVFTKSETGSISDQLGREFVLSEYKKLAIIDNRPVELEVRGFTIKDSVLFLRWNAYDDYKFEKYLLKIESPFGDYDTIIYDSKVSELSIPLFSGGRMNVTMMLYAKGVYYYENINYNNDLEFDVVYEDAVLFFSLNSPFKSYAGCEVLHNSSFDQNAENVENHAFPKNKYVDQKISTPDIFPVPLSFEFNFKSSFAIEERSRVVNLSNNYFYGKDNNNFRYYVFDDIVLDDYDYETNNLYKDESSLRMIDKQSGEVIKSMEGILSISPNGQYLYQVQGERLISYDPKTWEIRSEINYTDIIEVEREIISIYTSNDGLVILYHSENSNPYGYQRNFRSHLVDFAERNYLRGQDHRYYLNNGSGNNLGLGGELSSTGDYYFRSSNFSSASYPVIAFGNPIVTSFPGELISVLIDSDQFLCSQNENLSRRSLVDGSIYLIEELESNIIDLFSNGDNLCAVILQNEEVYELVVLYTDTFEEVSRRTLNNTVINNRMKFVLNAILIKDDTNKSYYWEIDD